MEKLWTEKEINFLKNNIKKKSLVDISKIINRPVKGIMVKLHRLGINTRKWSKNEDELLTEIYNKYPIRDLPELFNNRTKSSIVNRAFVLGLKRDKNNFSKFMKHKYNVDDYFFYNENIINSYWAGFISADGWINNDINLLGIKLSSKDHNHLLKFKSDIQTEAPILTGVSKCFNSECKYSMITIRSYRIISDLKNNFNIQNKKSLINIPPNINKIDNKLAFIVGLLDGDGTVYVKNNNNIRLTFLGTYKMLNWIKETISMFSGEIKSSIIKKGNIWMFSVSTKHSKNILNWCKENNLYYLERKLGKI